MPGRKTAAQSAEVVSVIPSALATEYPTPAPGDEGGYIQTIFRAKKPLPFRVTVWPKATKEGDEVMIGAALWPEASETQAAIEARTAADRGHCPNERDRMAVSFFVLVLSY